MGERARTNLAEYCASAPPEGRVVAAWVLLTTLTLVAPMGSGCGTPKPVEGGDPDVVPPRSLCRFDDPVQAARGVLAVAIDGGVVLVMSDGSTRKVHEFTAVRPPSETSFWLRLQPAGEDIVAVGTWWGPLEPTMPCELRDGALACPATERSVRISSAGEVLSDISQHFFRSSAGSGSTSQPDTGMPGPVPSAPQDPAAFNWSYPSGLTPMSRAVDSQGWFVAVLRDDYAAGVYRSPDATSNWTRLGKRLGQVEDVQVSNTAGTYLIFARGTDSFFVPKQVWRSDGPVSSEPELVQDSVQLVRPDAGVAEVLNYGYAVSINLSGDGLCAVNWEPASSGRQLTIHDLTMSGGKRAFLTEKIGIGRPSSLWWPPAALQGPSD